MSSQTRHGIAGQRTGWRGVLRVGSLVGLMGLSPALASHADAGQGRAAAERVEVTVYDDTNAVIPGALVELHSQRSSGTVFRVVADESGIARFHTVAADTYTVTASLQGFQDGRIEAVTVERGPAMRVTITLGIGKTTERINVQGAASDFAVRVATVGSRLAVPSIEVPQAIQVVSQELLQERGIVRMTEAVRTVSGSVTSDEGQFRYFLRGFEAIRLEDGFSVGMRQGADPNLIFSEVANVERVEVLKGPASVLYGRLEPGGVINKVLKRPTPTAYRAIEVNFGQYDLKRAAIDLGGRLTQDARLAYRANLSFEDSGSFRDHNESRRAFVAPLVEWRPTPATTVSLEGQWSRYDTQFDRDGLLAIGNRVADLPIERFLGEPSDGQVVDRRLAGGTLNHILAATWMLRSSARVSYYTWDAVAHRGLRLNADMRTLQRESVDSTRTDWSWFLQQSVAGTVSSGRLEHRLIAGFEYANGDSSRIRRRYPVGAIDIYSPVYGLSGRPPEAQQTIDYPEELARLSGVYAQDQISLGSRVKVLAGVRFDHFNERTRNNATGQDAVATNQAFTPRLGVTWLPRADLAFYTSYAQSIQPAYGEAADGRLFEPRRATQVEIGLKQEALRGRLITTLAGYEIRNRNVSTTDPANPGFSIQVGEQRSRGVEIDIAGRMPGGLTLNAGVAYIDAEVMKDNQFVVGNRLPSIPGLSASFWSSYQVQDGALAGLGGGAGLVAMDDRQGDLNNTFELPAFGRWDAALFYKARRYRVQVNFNNLSDVRYFESATARLRVQPGPPRTIAATMSVVF